MLHAQPHDLLRLAPSAAVVGDEPCPGWVRQSVAATPWAVVRRAALRDGKLPVGIRGPTRQHRWGGWLSPSDVIERLTPEALVERVAALPRRRVAEMPALAALAPVTALLAGFALAWGPTGSAGFELASGTEAVTAASDLDGIIRCPLPLGREVAAAMAHALESLAVRCDIQLETPAGGVALLEYARNGGAVVARGLAGPRLVADCWALAPAA